MQFPVKDGKLKPSIGLCLLKPHENGNKGILLRAVGPSVQRWKADGNF